MTNLLERAISTDDGDHAAKIIQDALGIESNECSTCQHEMRLTVLGQSLNVIPRSGNGGRSFAKLKRMSAAFLGWVEFS